MFEQQEAMGENLNLSEISGAAEIIHFEHGGTRLGGGRLELCRLNLCNRS